MILQRGTNYRIKYNVYPLSCLSVYCKQLITIPSDDCKLFSYNSNPTHALLASKRCLIDLEKMLF